MRYSVKHTILACFLMRTCSRKERARAVAMRGHLGGMGSKMCRAAAVLARGGRGGAYLRPGFFRYLTIVSTVPTRGLVSYQTRSIDCRMK